MGMRNGSPAKGLVVHAEGRDASLALRGEPALAAGDLCGSPPVACSCDPQSGSGKNLQRSDGRAVPSPYHLQ